MNHSKLFLVLVISLVSFTFLSGQTIWYVNDDNAAGGDGKSWATAFNDLQTALTNSSNGHQIWIAEGMYKPTTSTDRSIFFYIPRHVRIYGGFPNEGAATIFDRNPAMYPTILSGDIGNEGNSDNSYHVIYMEYPSSSNGLYGLTIQDGNANGDSEMQWHWVRGGGLFVLADGHREFIEGMKVEDCIFKNNSADVLGGGAYIRSAFNGNLNIAFTNTVFENNNSPNGQGGGICNDAYSGASNSSFTNCTFSNNEARYGGAMFNDGRQGGNCAPTITNCQFTNNKATESSGAIYNASYDNGTSAAVICNSIFEFNKADGWSGGAISYWGGGTDAGAIIDCQFLNNGARTAPDNGGAIMFDVRNNQAHTTLIKDCLFEGNASEFFGGALMIATWENGSSDANITGCSFVQNAATYAGALMLNGDEGDASPTISDCHFINNIADNGGAGITQQGTPIFTNCSFINNEASNEAGALQLWGTDGRTTTPMFTDCKFMENTATYGGAISHRGDNNGNCTSSFTQCLFIDNKASQDGGAVWNRGTSGMCTPVFTNNTFSNNTATINGDGFLNDNATPSILNSILWGGTGNMIVNFGNSTPFVSHSNIQGGYTGTNNLNIDPMFVDIANYNFSLSTNSDCIDAGNIGHFPPFVMEDIIGNPRIVNSLIDMGAYEYKASSFNLSARTTPTTCIDAANGTILLIYDHTAVDFTCDTLYFTLNGTVEKTGQNSHAIIKSSSNGPVNSMTATYSFNAGTFSFDLYNYLIPSGCYIATLTDCAGNSESITTYVKVSDIDNDNIPDCEDPDCNFPTNVAVSSTNATSCQSPYDGTIMFTTSNDGGTNLSFATQGNHFQTSNTFSDLWPIFSNIHNQLRIRNEDNGCVMALDTTIIIGGAENCSSEFLYCFDGVDNDGNGKIDCADDNCAPKIFLGQTILPTCPDGANGVISMQVNGSQEVQVSMDGGVTYRNKDATGNGNQFTFTDLAAGTYTFKSYSPQSQCTYSLSLTLYCTDPPPSCPTNISIKDSISTDTLFSATDTIFSTSVIHNDASVTFTAGKIIILEPGFEVKSGVTFYAKIEDCNTQFLKEEKLPLVTAEKLLLPTTESIPKLKQPTNLSLYPNPFQHQTTIEFELSTSSPINIQLYDINGRILKSLLSNTDYEAGKHQLTLDSRELQAGIYYVNMVTDTRYLIKKIMLLK